MKKIISLLTVLFILTFFAGCCGQTPEKPETNLEFWIAEPVTAADFDGYQEVNGVMGGRAFYGKGYAPIKSNEGNIVDPDECVIYEITAYPDFSDDATHITGIRITDPKIELYGFSLSSSFEEFESCMVKEGFEITESNENYSKAEMGKFSITFSKERIVIRVRVENREGIIF